MSSCARTEILIGKKGLFKLASAHVLIAGIGGVGSICAESLARAGVGEISIIDFDTIELSNINRQIIALHSTLKKLKTDVLKQRLLDINPNCIINTKNLFIDENEATNIANSDINFIADCIDTISSKSILIYHCLQRKKYIISSMGAGGKLDASKIIIDKMSKTINCSLAKVMRKKLRSMKVSLNFPVIYSYELSKSTLLCMNEQNEAIITKGTISYMPNIFGLMMASHIINKILKL